MVLQVTVVDLAAADWLLEVAAERFQAQLHLVAHSRI
jgi:hypothetical protein